MTGRIVMTGAAGGVAGMVRPYLERAVDQLVLTDRNGFPEASGANSRVGLPSGKCWREPEALFISADQPVEADWETVRECNIEGAISLYECAKLEGIERIVFASSLHAVGYMPAELPFGPSDVIRPDSLYGVSKVFGRVALHALRRQARHAERSPSGSAPCCRSLRTGGRFPPGSIRRISPSSC